MELLQLNNHLLRLAGAYQALHLCKAYSFLQTLSPILIAEAWKEPYAGYQGFLNCLGWELPLHSWEFVRLGGSYHPISEVFPLRGEGLMRTYLVFGQLEGVFGRQAFWARPRLGRA